jgi:hypothetical protein
MLCLATIHIPRLIISTDNISAAQVATPENVRQSAESDGDQQDTLVGRLSLVILPAGIWSANRAGG